MGAAWNRLAFGEDSLGAGHVHSAHARHFDGAGHTRRLVGFLPSDGCRESTTPDRVGQRPEAGENDRYTLKKYESEKEYFIDGTWQHTGIRLLALNGEHQPIGLDKNRNYEMLGWFVGVARKIARIEEIDFPDIVQEQPAWD